MHPVNRFLNIFGLQLGRIRKVPSDFIKSYNKQFKIIENNRGDFTSVFKAFRYDLGVHPRGYVDAECEFAARHLFRIKPEKILDIGSYRLFIIGLLGRYQVTTLDVRDRESECPNESIYTYDARSLEFPDSTFDCVVSLCALEHFGIKGFKARTYEALAHLPHYEEIFAAAERARHRWGLHVEVEIGRASCRERV